MNPLNPNFQKRRVFFMKRSKLCRIMVLVAAVSFGMTLGCSRMKPLAQKKNADQLYQEGMACFFKGRYDEAEGKLTTVIFEFPFTEKSTLAEVRLAELYYYQGKYAEASAYLEDFLKRHPSHKDAPYAYYLLGMCYFNQKPKAERDQTAAKNASSAFGELLARYPDSVWAEMARRHFDTCIDSLVKSEMLVGDFYFKRKNFEGASGRYMWLAQKYPSSEYTPRALFYLAKCFEASNKPEKAKSTLKHLLVSYPKSDYSDDAQSLLAKLEKKAMEKPSGHSGTDDQKTSAEQPKDISSELTPDVDQGTEPAMEGEALSDPEAETEEDGLVWAEPQDTQGPSQAQGDLETEERDQELPEEP